jgi:GT2 family glycosyltransferase
MPAHNVRPYLEESVGSVLGQTFADVELVILENGSTDGTGALAEELAAGDPRVKVFSRPGRLGNAAASNAAVAESRAPLLARADGDDVVEPDWLECLIEVLERNQDAVLVGTLFEGIDPDGHHVRPRDRSALLRPAFEAPFSHGGVLLHRKAFDAVGGYREGIEGWEDLDLFQRLGGHGRLLVVPQALYRVRFHGRSMTAERPFEEMRRVATARHRTERERFPDASPPPARRNALDELYMQSAMRLWRGQRPALLRWLVSQRLLGEAVRRPGLLAWGVLGALSPAALRRLVRALIARRDQLAGRRLPDSGPVEWRFG